jgi:hypothetical protein
LSYSGSPIAKISSAKPFRLSGQSIPVAGIPSWPLVAGDEVAMGESPGSIEFKDGSRLFLYPNSRLKLAAANGRTEARLQQGAVAYKFTRDSAVDIGALAHRTVPQGTLEGKIAVVDAAAYWNPAEQAFYALGPGSVRRQAAGTPSDPANMNPNPYNLDQIPGYRGYEPPWGNPPYTPPGPAPIVPPPAVTDPGQPPPTSNYRP